MRAPSLRSARTRSERRRPQTSERRMPTDSNPRRQQEITPWRRAGDPICAGGRFDVHPSDEEIALGSRDRFAPEGREGGVRQGLARESEPARQHGVGPRIARPLDARESSARNRPWILSRDPDAGGKKREAHRLMSPCLLASVSGHKAISAPERFRRAPRRSPRCLALRRCTHSRAHIVFDGGATPEGASAPTACPSPPGDGRERWPHR